MHIIQYTFKFKYYSGKYNTEYDYESVGIKY